MNVKKVNDMTGYDAVTAALTRKVDEEREVKEAIGYYLLKALESTSIGTKLIEKITQRDEALLEDGSVLWCCLLMLMQAKTDVKKGVLLEARTTARSGRGESVYEYATRVRSTSQKLAQADQQLRQPDEMVVGFILNGLPDHYEIWKESFKGRAKEQRTLTRLIVDLEEEANKEVATMANDEIMAMFQASRNARMVNLHQMWWTTSCLKVHVS